jgi:Holliday junction resolvase RusA-like endonuclease
MPISSWSTIIPVTPVPAARPRVPRYGKPYYIGRYAKFREAMTQWVTEQPPVNISENPLAVYVEFAVNKPKNPANSYPTGDIDNYVKAVLDSLQSRMFLKDDKQVEYLEATKRYVDNEIPHIKITFKETK